MPRRMRYSVIVTFFGILSLLYATSVFVRDYEIVPRRSPHQEHDHHLDNKKSEPAPAPATQDRGLHPLPPECDYCGPTDTLCKQYGEHNLARSRAYEGTNARLKRVIAKARRGEPVIISVLGGSVTKGIPTTNQSRLFVLMIHTRTRHSPRGPRELVQQGLPVLE
ncbi:CRISPR-associated endonuclease/helicase Cas3 [Tulasnella sp. 418]|nr:CRISPR-associated endonuclease/helicase Cas3 [Tulasnella sp. 418]